MEGLKNILIDLFFPRRCVVCGKISDLIEGKRYLCHKCKENMPIIKAKIRCEKCGIPLKEKGICTVCKDRGRSYLGGVAIFNYEDIKLTIERFKYEDKRYLSYGLGEIMYRYAKEYYPNLINNYEGICYVPMSLEKLKKNGFDHSRLLAESFSKLSGIPCYNIIIRERNTIPQNGLKTYSERRNNVKGAFKACGNIDITGLNLLLIDDIFTTGSSAEECSRVLYKIGAKAVFVYTLSASYKGLY